MKVFLSKNGNFLGLKNNNDEVLLSPEYEVISFFSIKDGAFITSKTFGSKIDRFSIIANRYKSNKSSMNYSPELEEDFIEVEKDFQNLMLLQKDREWNLFKVACGSDGKLTFTNHFTKYDSLKTYITDDSKTLGKYFEEITHIGRGFFKIKIVDVYEKETYIDEGENILVSEYNNFYWIIINYEGREITSVIFNHVDTFHGDLCIVEKITGRVLLITQVELFQVNGLLI